MPEQAGVHTGGGASGNAASVLDDIASPCIRASGIVDAALAAVHQPAEQCCPSRHCSSVEHAIVGSLAQPAISITHMIMARI